MTTQLIIRPEAELDIQATFEWYKAQSLGLGSEFVRAVDVCLSNVGRSPLAYPTIHQQARRALIRRFPYGLFYVFDPSLIAIVACFHSRRDPKQCRL